LEGLAYWTLAYRPLGNLLREPVSIIKPFSVDDLGIRDPVELVNHVYQSFQEFAIFFFCMAIRLMLTFDLLETLEERCQQTSTINLDSCVE